MTWMKKSHQWRKVQEKGQANEADTEMMMTTMMKKSLYREDALVLLLWRNPNTVSKMQFDHFYSLSSKLYFWMSVYVEVYVCPSKTLQLQCCSNMKFTQDVLLRILLSAYNVILFSRSGFIFAFNPVKYRACISLDRPRHTKAGLTMQIKWTNILFF